MNHVLLRIVIGVAFVAAIGGLALFFHQKNPSGFERYDAMFRATRDRNAAEVRRLVQSGADPSGIRDYVSGEPYMEFISPLMVAVGSRDHEIMEFLLSSGADPNLVEGPMWTPLMEAIENQDEYAVTQLLRYGADLSSGYSDDDDAIKHASRRALSSIRSILIGHRQAMNVEQADSVKGSERRNLK